MRLSNPRVWLVIACVFSLFSVACWSSSPTEAPAGIPIPPAKSRFPFPTVEPKVYQAEIYLTVGTTEDKYFIARKADRSRMDLDVGTESEIIEIRADKIYLVHSASKIYTEEILPTDLPGDVSDIGIKRPTLFQDIEYRQYDEVETIDGVVKYKTRPIEAEDADIFVWFDTKLGLIVRQEFTDKGDDGSDPTWMRFVYELRNVRLDVDDSVFTVPDGYRKVSRNEFDAAIRRKPKQN